MILMMILNTFYTRTLVCRQADISPVVQCDTVAELSWNTVDEEYPDTVETPAASQPGDIVSVVQH